MDKDELFILILAIAVMIFAAVMILVPLYWMFAL